MIMSRLSRSRCFPFVPAIILGMAGVLAAGSASAAGAGLDRLFRELAIITLAEVPPPMNVDLKDLDGRRVRLSDYAGKIVLLSFWTTWCPNCRAEMPELEKAFRQFAGKGVMVVTVDLQERASVVAAYRREYHMSYPILMDRSGSVGRSFGIRAIPTTYILNRKGLLIGRVMGPREWSGKTGRAFLAALAAVPVKQRNP
jgi:peroxiredoxin